MKDIIISHEVEVTGLFVTKIDPKSLGVKELELFHNVIFLVYY